MDDWFRGKNAGGWFAYVPVVMLKMVVRDSTIHDAILATSGTHKPSAVRAMSGEKKRLAVQALVEARRGDSGMYHGLDPLEILALLTRNALPKMKKPATMQQELWPAVPQGKGKGEGEKELLAPIAATYRKEGYEVYREIRTAKNRVDAVCHIKKGGLFGYEEIIAVELKNDRKQLTHAMDQLTTFGRYAHRSYLACTPALAFDFVEHHAVHKWDPHLLENKLKDAKIGLLLVWNDQVLERVEAQRREITPDKLEEIRAHLVPRNIAR